MLIDVLNMKRDSPFARFARFVVQIKLYNRNRLLLLKIFLQVRYYGEFEAKKSAKGVVNEKRGWTPVSACVCGWESSPFWLFLVYVGELAAGWQGGARGSVVTL
jgi:hypothetical protein